MALQVFSVITERRIGVSNNFTGPKGFEEVCHVIEVYNGSDFPQIDCRFSGNIRNDNANFHHHRRLDAAGEGFTLIRANCVEKTMHFARYRNKSAIVMVLLAMSEYPFRERPQVVLSVRKMPFLVPDSRRKTSLRLDSFMNSSLDMEYSPVEYLTSQRLMMPSALSMTRSTWAPFGDSALRQE